MNRFLISLLLLLSFLAESSSQSVEKKGVIVLGSYHAYYMNWSRLRGFKRNSSVPDFTSRQLGWTLSNGVTAYNPEICLLQTGPEDLLKEVSPDMIMENISRIADELKSDSIQLVIISGIQDPDRRAVGDVKNLNIQIEEWCAENNILYIDISELLISGDAFTEEKKIKPEYQEKIINRINNRLREYREMMIRTDSSDVYPVFD